MIYIYYDNMYNIIKNKINYKGSIFFNKTYPNGTIEKNLDFTKILKLKWKPKIFLNQGLDKILKELNLKYHL